MSCPSWWHTMSSSLHGSMHACDIACTPRLCTQHTLSTSRDIVVSSPGASLKHTSTPCDIARASLVCPANIARTRADIVCAHPNVMRCRVRHRSASLDVRLAQPDITWSDGCASPNPPCPCLGAMARAMVRGPRNDEARSYWCGYHLRARPHKEPKAPPSSVGHPTLGVNPDLSTSHRGGFGSSSHARRTS